MRKFIKIIMGKEIERKFLVRSDKFIEDAAIAAGITLCSKETAGKKYRQGYIPTLNGMTVRIRIAGDKGFITMKDKAVNFSRHEYEYEIPLKDAEEMIDIMCVKPLIEKRRYVIPTTSHDGQPLHWEVDVFEGDNKGLTVAEIELPSEETLFDLPEWIGTEVTGQKQYYNSHLINNPYKNWKQDQSTPLLDGNSK